MIEVTLVQPAATGRYFGICIEHIRRWWLVQLDQRTNAPLSVIELTGQLTDRLRRCSGLTDVRGLYYAASIKGEWVLAPGRNAASDIDGNPWGSETSEREHRLACVAIDLHTLPLPAGFTSVFKAQPIEDRPVIAIRRSGYCCARMEIITARYMPTYRPRSPWRDISGDAVSDTGEQIMGWRYADDWLLPS